VGQLKPSCSQEAIATGNPPYRRSAAGACRLHGPQSKIAQEFEETRSLHLRRSGPIEPPLQLPWRIFGQEESDHFNFFPEQLQLSPLPSTCEGHGCTAAWRCLLAETVDRDALAQAGCSAEQITHLTLW